MSLIQEALEDKIDEFWNFYDFEDVEIVVIRHEWDYKTIRANPQDPTKADWHGSTGQYAQWLVRPDRKNNTARFQNSKTGHYLRIHKVDKQSCILDVSGDDTASKKETIFKLNKHSIGVYQLQSNEYPNEYITIDKDNGFHIDKVSDKNNSRLHFYKRGDAKSFTHPYLFQSKHVVVIESADDTYLNVKNEKDNDVQANGKHWDDDTSLWEVEPHEQGRFIKLKNLKNGKYIKITKNGSDVTCDGDGDAECNLEVHVIDAPNHVKLTSVKWPESFIAVENTKVKIGKGGGYCPLTFYRQ